MPLQAGQFVRLRWRLHKPLLQNWPLKYLLRYNSKSDTLSPTPVSKFSHGAWEHVVSTRGTRAATARVKVDNPDTALLKQ